MLSRVHAEVICAGEAIIFVDRESQNGSYINGVRVTSQALLPGDVIRLGDTTLKAVEEDLSQEVCWDENAPSSLACRHSSPCFHTGHPGEGE
jgi:pSer/pThr/pTyr-binding forkhead associated (FHA) protein